MNLLKKMTHPEEQPVPKLHAHHRTAAEQCTPQMAAHSTGRSGDRKIHIGSDDITNLRIELGLCNDVLEFIDRM